MAFTLKIQSKALFGNKAVDFKKLVTNCGLQFGHNNEFYVLEDGAKDNTVVLYNPNRIGRGIYFDGRKMKEGKVEISYNIPTTEAEITDFIIICKELVRQLKKVEMYCVEEECKYDIEQLEANKERMIQFSVSKLNEFCANKEYESHIFTLAMWPLVLTEDLVSKFERCTDLCEFEQILHDKQCMDVYYAKPKILRKQTGEIGAFYTFTEECESIFPLKADGFINLDGLVINEGYVRYFIFSENRILDDLYDYDKFIQYMLDHGAKYFDKSHIFVPSMTKVQIEEMAKVTAC